MNIKKMGLLILISILIMNVNAQSLSGDWKGTLSVQGTNLELIFHITDKDGAYTSTMDVPAQGATGIPVQKTELPTTPLKSAYLLLKLIIPANSKATVLPEILNKWE